VNTKITETEAEFGRCSRARYKQIYISYTAQSPAVVFPYKVKGKVMFPSNRYCIYIYLFLHSLLVE